MKFLKKHFAKFIMAFTLAFTSLFVAFGCNTYAYSINNDGDLVSDNLFNLQNQTQSSGSITMICNNGKISFEGQSTQSLSFEIGQIYLESGDYYIYDFYNSNPFVFIFNMNSTPRNQTFTISTSGTYTIYVWISENVDLQDVILYPMIVNGTTRPNQWEPYGIWYSQENYDNLQDSYNQMSQQYKELKDTIYYGFFAFLDTIDITCYDSLDNPIGNYTSDLTTLIQNNYIVNNVFYFSTFVTDYLNKNVNFVNCGISFHFTNMNYTFVDFVFTTYTDFNFGANFIFGNNITNSAYLVFTIDNNVVNYQRLSKYASLYNSYTISSISFSNLTNIAYPDIILASSDSYALGYNDGVQSTRVYIDSLTNNIQDLSSTNYALRQSINDLTIAYNDLNTSYENMLNGNNFANLFFTIAETPFASFKQIWNVDFLGVNLAGFVTGILFLGLIIWVIKKIF